MFPKEDSPLLINNFNVQVINFTLFIPLFQVTNAQKYGAKAILIYNDPQDSAPVPDEDLYPHGWWLPRSGVQRGSILLGTGDPLTPRYPSKGTAEMFWFD